MDKYKKVFDRAYSVFVPSVKEFDKLSRVANEIISLLIKNANSKGVNVEFKFGGSYAKGTWIKNESDIDIFAIFNSEEEMKGLSFLVPKDFISTFGTRKYFKGIFKGVKIEVVPVRRFSDMTLIENSIDLSVLHANYINSFLSKSQKNDVIILKAFCKANNCYGSETYMHGFSGYSLEVMIKEFGSFMSLVKAVNSWTLPVRIGKSAGDSAFPIFLRDPTNPKRNICASVNEENLSKFVLSIKRFYLVPSFDFFIKENLKDKVLKEVKLRGTKLFVFTTKIIEPRDMFLSKYVKNLDKLVKELKMMDVEIYSYDIDYTARNATLFLQIKNLPKSKTKAVAGPAVFSDIGILKNFIKAHKKVFIAGKYVCYDKPYNVKDFNKFILLKIKEYMSPKSIFIN
ncbi:MAG: nucleotidyltransferase domain-containing protein [Candidatus Parvarchaeota archaeon]|jgi:tRNA nucleotidyltransferase (CCA-adding enzyme)|nr:nucleotidyltransferase domain-containing protein [Candidatus Parvarchaeota archaeon]MCL5106968.1 nucleotidyltransferase domain-containing protein [Candidatus Parvarchaeota archaeon]